MISKGVMNMKAVFRFIEPKVNLEDEYLERIVENIMDLLDYPLLHERIDDSISCITTPLTPIDDYETTSAMLELVRNHQTPYLQVQIINSFQPHIQDANIPFPVMTRTSTEIDPIANDLKMSIKDTLINDWKECVWIYDMDASIYASNLFTDIYALENGIRHFINALLIQKKGVMEWESHLRKCIQSKLHNNRSCYTEIAPFFRHINTNLLSFDLYDFFNTNEIYSELKAKNIRTENKDITNIFLEHVLSNYFDENFINLLKSVLSTKKHISQNNLIDLDTYNNSKKEIDLLRELTIKIWEKYNLEVHSKF